MVPKKQAKKIKIKAENEVKIKVENEVEIKVEDGVDSSEDTEVSPLLRQRIRQPSVDTVFLSEDEAPRWPQDYHVCDIAKAFKKPPQGISRKTAFRAHFPDLSWKKSTFYDNYKLWKTTPTEFRMKFVDYGRTKKGSWRGFLAARAKHLSRRARRTSQ
jgi:hypothetical protein